jgi:putative ABC transport system permease protein
MALHSVTVNKLRTILSLLGITIGIFAIISVFTLLDAMEGAIRESIASMGDNVVYIDKWSWSFEEDYAWWEYIKRPVPRYTEYEEIQKKSQLASTVSFFLQTYKPVRYQDATKDAVLCFFTQQYQQIRSFEIEKGRYFSSFESTSGKNVAILGNKTARSLFENEDPLGKYVKIEGRNVLVIGVTKQEGTGIGDPGFDEAVMLPLNFARHIYNIRSEELNPNIIIKAKNNIPLEQLKDEIRVIMRNKRGLKPSQKDNFSLNQSSVILKGFESMFSMINLVGWIIGGFSILVGGFGIANIMFVSVKERTNQIGIQKALGARKSFILSEYLFEAMLLSLAGGITGLILVFSGTLLLRLVADFSISLTVNNIFTGLFVSAIIGIISGFAPAWSAAKLNPVEAINTTF